MGFFRRSGTAGVGVPFTYTGISDNATTVAINIDSDENVAINVPSGNELGFNPGTASAVQIGSNSAITGNTALAGASGWLDLLNNAYYNVNHYETITTGASSLLELQNGYISFYQVASQTAGDTISFTSTFSIDPAGEVSGTTVLDEDTLVSNSATRLATQQSIKAYVDKTSTTTALEDVGDTINTSAAKVAGFQVFNTTTSKPMWAVGSADADVWVDATGATIHSPV